MSKALNSCPSNPPSRGRPRITLRRPKPSISTVPKHNHTPGNLIDRLLSRGPADSASILSLYVPLFYSPSYCSVTLENPENTSVTGSIPSGVAGCPTGPPPPASSCSDLLCRILRMFTESIDTAGMICTYIVLFSTAIPNEINIQSNMQLTGGVMFRKRPQFVFANHLCCFVWLAPLWLPSRRVSSLSSNRWTMSLPALDHKPPHQTPSAQG